MLYEVITIQLTTEMALQFNDKYGEAVDEEELLELDGDLDRLGQALEERFVITSYSIHYTKLYESVASPSLWRISSSRAAGVLISF